MSVERKSYTGFRALLAMIMISVIVLFNCVSVFAAYTTASEVVQAYAPGGSKNTGSTLPAELSSYVTIVNGSVQVGYESVTVNGKTYEWNQTNASNIITVGDALDAKLANKQSQNANDQQAISNFSASVGQFGIAADVSTGMGLLSGFVGPLTTLLGIIVVAVSLGLTVYTAFDICYIVFPVFRNKCDDAKTSGGVMAKTKSDGTTGLRFVSDDAVDSIKETSTEDGGGKNPLVVYFKKRLLTYLICAVLLFVLLTGRITIFTEIALKLVSGVLDLIQANT